MAYFTRECCCECEPPIAAGFISEAVFDSLWEVAAGTVSLDTFGAVLNVPGAVLLLQHEFREPFLLLSATTIRTFTSGTRPGGRILFDVQDEDNFQFLEITWDVSFSLPTGCDPPVYPHRMRFGRVSGGMTSTLKESQFISTSGYGEFPKLCIRPDGFVVAQPQLPAIFDGGLSRHTVAVRTEVTSARVGFGQGDQSDLELILNEFSAQPYQEGAVVGNCVDCRLHPESLAARFADYELPDEIEVVIPAFDAPTGEDVTRDCSCVPGTYVLRRMQYDTYEMEFPIDCYDDSPGCDGVASVPMHDILSIRLVWEFETFILQAERLAYIGPYPVATNWSGTTSAFNLDPLHFEIELPSSDSPDPTACGSSRSAIIRGVG